MDLQLALHTGHLHQRPTVAQDNLAGLVLGDEAKLLDATSLNITRAPDLSGELVTWANGGCKASLELLKIFGIATTKLTQDTVGSGVPAEEAVDDSTTEAHLLAGFGGGVQRIVVAIQTIDLLVGVVAMRKRVIRTYRYKCAVSMSVCTT